MREVNSGKPDEMPRLSLVAGSAAVLILFFDGHIKKVLPLGVIEQEILILLCFYKSNYSKINLFLKMI